MTKALIRLKSRMAFLESKWFGNVSWTASVTAPLPLATQLVKALTAESVEGIAIEAYSLLCVLHAIMALRGVKSLDPRIVTVFALTSLIAGSITITTIARGGALIF